MVIPWRFFLSAVLFLLSQGGYTYDIYKYAAEHIIHILHLAFSRSLIMVFLSKTILFFSIIVASILPGEPWEVVFEEVRFNQEFLEKYPFLSSLQNQEMADGKKIHSKPYIAQVIVNEQPVIIAKIIDSFGSSYNCGALGCSHSFYVRNDDGRFEEIAFLIADSILAVNCDEQDYLITAGGAGAGINRPLGIVWRIRENKLEKLRSIEELSKSAACTVATE